MAIEKGRLRDNGLQSERVLWPTRVPGAFEREVEAMEQRVGLTTLEKAVAWAQTKSMWPDTFGLACCAIEMMSIVSSRYDIARFGMEAFRSSPRQADLLIVSGRVVHKMAAPLRQVYDQMLEPKWVIAMGACASSGGMFNNYTTQQGGGQDRRAVDFTPRCPPRPEALMEGNHPPPREDPRPACPGVRAARSRVLNYKAAFRGSSRHREGEGRDDPHRRHAGACRRQHGSLRDELGFDFLSDIGCADYLGWGAKGVSVTSGLPAGVT
jgi:NADH-quinone oxidoreductase subunit B